MLQGIFFFSLNYAAEFKVSNSKKKLRWFILVAWVGSEKRQVWNFS